MWWAQRGEYWGEPKNKNKLEKTAIAHDPELGEAVEKAGEGLEGLVKEVKNCKSRTLCILSYLEQSCKWLFKVMKMRLCGASGHDKLGQSGRRTV